MLHRQFGFEFEHVSELDHPRFATGLEALHIPVDRYATGSISCPEGCYSGWQVKSDGSITPENDWPYGIELVSPPLTFKAMPEIRRALKFSREHGRINSSCGLHVHVSATELVPLLRDRNVLAFVTKCWDAIEDVLFTYMPASRRANDFAIRGIALGNKYQAFNLSPLQRSGRPTIEFRLHSATLNPTKAISFAALCVGFIDYMTARKAELEKISPTFVGKVEPKLVRTRNGSSFYLVRDQGKWHIESAKVKARDLPNLDLAYKEFKKALGLTARSYLSAFQYPHYGNAMDLLCNVLNVNGMFRGYLEDRYDFMMAKFGPAGVVASQSIQEDEDNYYDEPELEQDDLPLVTPTPVPPSEWHGESLAHYTTTSGTVEDHRLSNPAPYNEQDDDWDNDEDDDDNEEEDT